MVRSHATRASILRELENERQVIIDRYMDSEGLSAPLHPTHHLPWYLDISKEWGLHHLLALSRMPIGTLLDIGAYYGLIAGVAYRMGWRVAAVDVISVPAYSSLKIPERKIECGIYNACTDVLPFPDQSFDAILLCEVLEHLMYSPLPMFREIKRVLRPDGHLLISTPNPAGLGKLIRLALGAASLEPHVDCMLTEGHTFHYQGLTFFETNRESKLWTVREISKALGMCGLRLNRYYYYGNTVGSKSMSFLPRAKRLSLRLLMPLVKKFPIAGGSVFVIASPRPA